MKFLSLGTISDSVMGQAPPSSACNTNAVGYPFVKAGEFGVERPIIREWTTEPLKRARSTDVLLCVVGATAGKLNLGCDCAIGRSVAAIRPQPEKLDQKYLYYFLQSWTEKLRVASQGSAQGVITREMIARLEIPHLPLATQKYIARVLEQADQLRKQAQQMERELNQLAQSLFLEMFGDPVTNPKKWPSQLLPELLFFQEGPGVRNWQFRSSGIKLLNVGNIVNGKLELSNTETHLDSDEVQKRYSHFLADEGDLVMASSGATWGKTAWVKSEHLPLCMNTSTIRFRPRDSLQVSDSYMWGFLNSIAFKRQIERLITGSAQPNFGPAHLKQVRMLLPPFELQRHYQLAMEGVMEMSMTVQNELAAKGRLFDSLMQRAFNGELTAPERKAA